MDTFTIIVIVAIAGVLVVALALAWLFLRGRKTNDLENRYGTEYERVAKMRGRRKAVAELNAREQRVSAYEIHGLGPMERTEFANRWTSIQAEFVDAPRTAVQHADVLLHDVMVARGYPTSDFEQRAADLSVEYGDLVRNYRSAQAISQRAGNVTTEDLRRALLMYRTMFESLLKVEEAAAVPAGVQ